jgi:hypothetical protein
MAEIDIRIMDPAEVTLPADVQQLAFLNRSVFPVYLHPDSAKWTDQEFFILDTIMYLSMFKGIMTTMTASPLYDLDTIRIIRARRMDTASMLEPLTDEGLQHLKDRYPADALMSLEYYNISDSLHVRRSREGDPFMREAYMGLYTVSLWRLYDLIRDTIIDEYLLRDTSQWYTYGEAAELAIANLPEAVDAIRVAGQNAGSRYAARISPAWIGAPRYYYTSGSREMRKAARLAGAGDWKLAAETWKVLAYNEDIKLAAKASFNMALACEMEDLFLAALDWAIKSYSLRQEKLTREYFDLLKLRYEHAKELARQLPSDDG